MIRQTKVTGVAALNYLKEALSRGRVLSDYINELPLTDGEIYAFVPEGVSTEKLYDFENGGLYPVDAEVLAAKPGSLPIPNEARSVVVEMIQRYLTLSNNNCCLFEDQLRSVTDPVTKASELDYVHLTADDLFYFFGADTTDPKILKAWKVSEAHVFLCVLGSLDIDVQQEFKHQREISRSLLEKFVAGVSSFFIKAYDHEGYLMWVKA